MIKWIIRMMGPYTGTTDLSVGSRIRTKHGYGVITGGSVCVKLDNPVRGQHLNDRTWVFNLSKFEEKEKLNA